MGGLAIITKSLASEFESCQRFACRVLYRLSAHSEIQTAVVDNGAIPLLNGLLYKESPLLRKFAVMCLCNISTHPTNMPKVRKSLTGNQFINAQRFLACTARLANPSDRRTY